MKTLKKIIGILTVLGMIMGAFPQSAAAEVVASETVPVVKEVNFLANDAAVPVNTDGSYQLEISANPADEYLLDFDDANTVIQNSTALNDGVYPLYLEDTNVPLSFLNAYYASKPAEYQTYLDAAAEGLEPFAYIDVQSGDLNLLDGAAWNLATVKKPMTVPGDFVEGIYTVSGNLEYGTQATYELPLSFTLVISNGLTISTQTVNRVGSETPQLIGDGIKISDPSNYVVANSSWALVTTRPEALVSYDVTVNVVDLAGNTEVEILPYDLKVYNPILGQQAGIMILPPASANLLGVNPGVAQRYEIYADAGAEVNFNTGLVSLSFSGNLDLTKVKNSYTLTYDVGNATTLSEAIPQVQSNNTRDINVIDTKGPNALKNYVATGFDGYVQLKWDNPTNPDFAGVNIYRSTEKSFDWKITVPLKQIDKSFSSYEDRDVVNGTTYYYVLVPRDDMSPANYGLATETLTATPTAVVLVASANTGNSSYIVTTEETGEVKSDITETNDNPITQEEDKSLPAFGIFVLILLVLIGLYLLYLQKPEWFGWMFFWKNKKKPNSKKK